MQRICYLHCLLLFSRIGFIVSWKFQFAQMLKMCSGSYYFSKKFIKTKEFVLWMSYGKTAIFRLVHLDWIWRFLTLMWKSIDHHLIWVHYRNYHWITWSFQIECSGWTERQYSKIEPSKKNWTDFIWLYQRKMVWRSVARKDDLQKMVLAKEIYIVVVSTC